MAERNKRMADRKHPEKPDWYWCSVCQDYHPANQFGVNKARKYELSAICKTAANIANAKYASLRPKSKNPKRDRRHPTDPNLFWCGHHKVYEPRDGFYKKDTLIGLSSYCKVAYSEQKAKWYQDNIIKKTEPSKDKLSAWCKRMMDNPHYFQDIFHTPATPGNIAVEAQKLGM